jgi:hypothetical protein
MSTGQKKVNIFLKKFLTQQHITTNFLDYLHNLILEDHMALVGVNGVYTYPITGQSDAPDRITVLTPGESVPGDLNGPVAKMDDGKGHIMSLSTAERTSIAVPNDIGVEYQVGVRFNWQPEDTEINVRTGIIKWSLYREAVGELGQPNAVSYHNNTLTLHVDNICSDMMQYGRIIRVYLNTPASQSLGDLFEDVQVVSHSIPLEKNGELGFIDIPNGQIQFFIPGKSYTIDKLVPAPLVFTVTTIDDPDSGGVGYTRINVDKNLIAYTVLAGSFITTGYNVVNLSGTLGQGLSPTLNTVDYSIYMPGVTVTSNNLLDDDNYIFLFSYIGTGLGNQPGTFNWVYQQQLPENVMQMLLELKKWQEYAKQRNAYMLRGGGQFTFASGVLSWNGDFYVVNPFRGDYRIPAGSISGIINDDVIYVKLINEIDVINDGTIAGEIWVKNNSKFTLDGNVLIGDCDSSRVPGVIKGIGVDGQLYIEDGLGSPLDLSTYTATKGSWIQPTDLEFFKDQINTGDLRPSGNRVIDEEILVIAMSHTNTLIFKNGVLTLEDGDSGEIGNLPSGVNWVSNISELRNSVNLTSDDNVALISPKAYDFTTNLVVDKNLTWAGLSDRVVANLDEAVDIKIAWDASTSGIHQNTEFRHMRFVGLGAGGTLTIDNAGANKPMYVNLLDCVFTNMKILVTKSVPTQPIILTIEGCRDIESSLGIEFPVSIASDMLKIKNFKFSGAVGDYVQFGDASLNPGASALLEDVSGASYFKALSSGSSNPVTLRNCRGTLANGRMNVQNPEQMTLTDVNPDIALIDEQQYARHSLMTVLFGGGLMNYAGGTLTWSENLKITDPIHGSSVISSGSLGGLSDGSVIYAKFYRPRRFWKSGTAGGVAYIADTSPFNDNDEVLVGDNDSKISGYVGGTPVAGQSVLVDNGSGTPIDISAYLIANGSWIKRTNTNLDVGVLGVGDLARDINGKISDDIFIVGTVDAKGITFVNGVRIEAWWIYEETAISPGYVFGDTITLPVDSRNSNGVKKYQKGIGHLQIEENGLILHSEPVNVPGGTFTPSYNSGTGLVSVPDGVDMSNVLAEDTFIDANLNEFLILGAINNTTGAKGFKIATGQTVEIAGGAKVVRKHYDEIGVAYSWQNTVTSKKTIPAGSVLKFRVVPKEYSGRTVNA